MGHAGSRVPVCVYTVLYGMYLEERGGGGGLGEEGQTHGKMHEINIIYNMCHINTV